MRVPPWITILYWNLYRVPLEKRSAMLCVISHDWKKCLNVSFSITITRLSEQKVHLGLSIMPKCAIAALSFSKLWINLNEKSLMSLDRKFWFHVLQNSFSAVVQTLMSPPSPDQIYLFVAVFMSALGRVAAVIYFL